MASRRVRTQGSTTPRLRRKNTRWTWLRTCLSTLAPYNDGEVRKLGIEVGCPVIYKPAFEQLQGTRVTGTAVDNRGACAALVGIAKRLHERRPACDVYLVGTVWEEFNLRGAMMAARTVKPDLAVMLDVTLAGDTHDLRSRFEDELGKGPLRAALQLSRPRNAQWYPAASADV